MDRDTGNLGKGVLFVFLANLGWSLSGVFVRFLPGLTGWQLNCWRGLATSIFLALFLVAVYRGSLWARLRETPLVAVLLCASFFALGSTLYVTSLTLTSTANVACIGSLAPILAAMLSSAVTGERPPPSAFIAALLAIAGVAIIVWDGLGDGNWLGSVVALLVALCFALQTLAIRRYRQFDMVPAICLGGLMVFAVAALVGDGLSVPAQAIATLSLMGVVQLAIPLIFFVRAARHLPAVTITLLAMLDIVLNPLWAFIGTGERPAPMTWIGGGVMVLAIVIGVVAPAIRQHRGQPAASTT